MVVTLAADGRLYIRDEYVDRGSSCHRLHEHPRSHEGDTVVYVRADKKIPYGEVMEILGRVGETGYRRVSLLSQPSPKSAPRNALRCAKPMQYLRPMSMVPLARAARGTVSADHRASAAAPRSTPARATTCSSSSRASRSRALAKFGEAEEMIETVDIPPVQAADVPKPVEEIKPDLTDVVTSTEGKHEEQVRHRGAQAGRGGEARRGADRGAGAAGRDLDRAKLGRRPGRRRHHAAPRLPGEVQQDAGAQQGQSALEPCRAPCC